MRQCLSFDGLTKKCFEFERKSLVRNVAASKNKILCCHNTEKFFVHVLRFVDCVLVIVIVCFCFFFASILIVLRHRSLDHSEAAWKSIRSWGGLHVLYRVLVKYCVFSKILICIPDSVFSRCQCVYTHQAGKKTSAAAEQAEFRKFKKNVKEKHNI